MNVEKKEEVKSIWSRGLYMLLFLVVSGLVKGIVFAVAVVQFILVALDKGANQPLSRFGQGLSTYLYEITQFLVFNTEHKPFPFEDWSNAPPAPQGIVVDQEVGERG
ncbi:MAG: DUF4389 domain-containing protein [Nitrospinaceae bacterium]|jgi:hypothetical protein|nr:DUF4389 domain-containing protein [Nitrospinaceae bacterium]|tara:strand:- start:87 stop:407 length:321 start_codon:yes stop_codon:yes gene_type:complete